MPDEAISPHHQPLLHFRAAALTRSVLVGWAVLVILTAQAFRQEVVLTTQFLASGGALLLVMGISTAMDWGKVMAAQYGQWAAWGWAVLTTLALGSVALIPEMFPAAQPLFAGVVALTGVVLERVKHVFVTILAMFMLGSAGLLTGQVDGLAGLVIPMVTMGVVAAATAFLGAQFEREAARSTARLAELQRQRLDFERLWAISTTLAGAESLAEGLPDLVGTICRYLDAQVGVVFLYHPEDHTLRVMSPIWVNGYTLEVGDIRLAVSEGGVIQQVFRSGRPFHVDQIGQVAADAYGVLAELGLSEALVAPLRVEGFKVGVIAVGDPYHGPFRPDQLDQLGSLAAPAALVLSQLGRYEAAAEMTRRMQEIAQMKTDFVSVVSHELRTPLTSIIGSLDTVARPELAPPTDTARNLLQSARRQAGRLQRLIEDLLMVSRIDRQAVPVYPEVVEVRSFLEEIAATVQGIDRIEVSVEPDDLHVKADPDHLGRIFINLVENAAKYAPGSPVELVARAVGSRVDISVVDHGEGIPPDQWDRVFDRFTQVEHSDTRTRGGTGLGLSIVKGLAEAMDGTVQLTETPGGGATFTVSLPPATVTAVGRR